MVQELDTILRTSKRRDFLKLAAMGGMALFFPPVLTGCGSDVVTNPGDPEEFTMGSAAGPLNFVNAYAQLMLDFYSRMAGYSLYSPNSSFPISGMTQQERSLIGNLIDQKGGTFLSLSTLTPHNVRVSGSLLFHFETVDFTNRDSIMPLAATLEDLGVAAVNGLMTSSVKNSTDLALLAQIASNWARHAAMINDMNDIHANGVTGLRSSFVRTVNGQGLDAVTSASDALATIQPYFINTLSITGA